ncbi:hypothetical protein [Schlesneria sp. T3-172]|uniref:hypothetical protein n=1 Tax=Schlesneria sphaerica TaxID=3373610 RepID=UPI0037CC5432
MDCLRNSTSGVIELIARFGMSASRTARRLESLSSWRASNDSGLAAFIVTGDMVRQSKVFFEG